MGFIDDAISTTKSNRGIRSPRKTNAENPYWGNRSNKTRVKKRYKGIRFLELQKWKVNKSLAHTRRGISILKILMLTIAGLILYILFF